MSSSQPQQQQSQADAQAMMDSMQQEAEGECPGIPRHYYVPPDFGFMCQRCHWSKTAHKKDTRVVAQEKMDNMQEDGDVKVKGWLMGVNAGVALRHVVPAAEPTLSDYLHAIKEGCAFEFSSPQFQNPLQQLSEKACTFPGANLAETVAESYARTKPSDNRSLLLVQAAYLNLVLSGHPVQPDVADWTLSVLIKDMSAKPVTLFQDFTVLMVRKNKLLDGLQMNCFTKHKFSKLLAAATVPLTFDSLRISAALLDNGLATLFHFLALVKDLPAASRKVAVPVNLQEQLVSLRILFVTETTKPPAYDPVTFSSLENLCIEVFKDCVPQFADPPTKVQLAFIGALFPDTAQSIEKLKKFVADRRSCKFLNNLYELFEDLRYLLPVVLNEVLRGDLMTTEQLQIHAKALTFTEVLEHEEVMRWFLKAVRLQPLIFQDNDNLLKCCQWSEVLATKLAKNLVNTTTHSHILHMKFLFVHRSSTMAVIRESLESKKYKPETKYRLFKFCLPAEQAIVDCGVSQNLRRTFVGVFLEDLREPRSLKMWETYLKDCFPNDDYFVVEGKLTLVYRCLNEWLARAFDDAAAEHRSFSHKDVKDLLTALGAGTSFASHKVARFMLMNFYVGIRQKRGHTHALPEDLTRAFTNLYNDLVKSRYAVAVGEELRNSTTFASVQKLEELKSKILRVGGPGSSGFLGTETLKDLQNLAVELNQLAVLAGADVNTVEEATIRVDEAYFRLKNLREGLGVMTPFLEWLKQNFGNVRSSPLLSNELLLTRIKAIDQSATCQSLGEIDRDMEQYLAIVFRDFKEVPLHGDRAEDVSSRQIVADLFPADDELQPRSVSSAQKMDELRSFLLEKHPSEVQIEKPRSRLVGKEELIREIILAQEANFFLVACVEHDEIQHRETHLVVPALDRRAFLAMSFVDGVEAIARVATHLGPVDDQVHQQHTVIFEALNAFNHVLFMESASHKVLCKEEFILHTKKLQEVCQGTPPGNRSAALASDEKQNLQKQLDEERQKREDMQQQVELLRANLAEVMAKQQRTETPRVPENCIPEGFAIKQMKMQRTTTTITTTTEDETLVESNTDSHTVTSDVPSCLLNDPHLTAGESELDGGKAGGEGRTVLP